MTEQPAASEPPQLAWFSDTSPGLLTNRTIRDFLLAYSPPQWPAVIKLVLLHGIICLQKSFGQRVPSLSDLHSLVQTGSAAVAVEETVPALKAEIQELEARLESFAKDLGAGTVLSQQTAGKPRQAATTGGRPGPPETTPTVGERAPAAEVPASHPSVHPDWWGHAVNIPKPRASPKRSPQPPPRLAYSLQPARSAPNHTRDDLPTAEYLTVPGSGYGQQHAPQQPAEQPSGQWQQQRPDSRSYSSTQQRDGAGPAGGKENQARQKAVPPAKTRHADAQSRVKLQLEQQKALAQQREAARQQRLKAAVGHRDTPKPSAPAGTMIPRHHKGGYLTEHPPTEIADSLIANPWAAALVGSSDQGATAEAAISRVGYGPFASAAAPSSAAPSSTGPVAEQDTDTYPSGDVPEQQAASHAWGPADSAQQREQLVGPPSAPAATDHWESAARASAGGAQDDASLQQPPAAAGSHPTRAQHKTVWVSDFGHMDSPRFTQAAGKRWQEQLGSLRDHPPHNHMPSPSKEAQVQPHDDGPGPSTRHAAEAKGSASPLRSPAGSRRPARGGADEGMTADGKWDFDVIVQN